MNRVDLALLGLALAFLLPLPVLADEPGPAITGVDCVSNVFTGDTLTMFVRIDNATADRLQTTLDVSQIPEEQYRRASVDKDLTFKPVIQRKLDLNRGPNEVTVTLIPQTAGKFCYRLQLPSREGEKETKNNRYYLIINVMEPTARVLLISGRPTWEYRHLAPLLIRDPGINVSCYLQSADVDYEQQGNTQIDRWPRSQSEWFQYDVIVLLDADAPVPDNVFNAIAASVANNGAGLIVVGGPQLPELVEKMLKSSQHKFLKLLPVTLGKYSAAPTTAPADVFHVEPSEAGRTHPMLRLWPDEKRHAAAWEQMEKTTFYDAYPIAGVKDGATALLRRKAADGKPGDPLMVVAPAGKGQVVFLSLNSTWRWRTTAGGADYDAFWIRLIQSLAEQRRDERREKVLLSLDKNSCHPGEQVTVRLRVLDAMLMKQLASGQLVVIAYGRDCEREIEMTADPAGQPLFTGKCVVPQTGGEGLKIEAMIRPPGQPDAKPLPVALRFLDVKPF